MRKVFLIFALLWGWSAYGQATQVATGPVEPATCDPTVGQLFFNNSTLPGVLKYCSATNTWSVVSTGAGSTLFPWTTLASTGTPSLTVNNGSANYFMSVTSNITAVTTSGSATNGTYIGIDFKEDGTGGHTIPTANFPANFIFPPGCVFTTTANANNWLAWTFDGTNWQPVPGGGGSCGALVLQTNGTNNGSQTTLNLAQGSGITIADGGTGTVTVTGRPATGAANVLQKADGSGNFVASNCTETSTVLNCLDEGHFRGPNLGVDITVSPFNARAISTSFIPSTTGTITGGTNSLAVASATNWQKNDGLALVSGGATNCGTAPAAPTVTPSLASSMTGTGHAVAGATGSTSYSYVVIAVSQGGCYTAASAIGSTSTGNATLGATNLAITSCANSAGTVTCTVGSTTGLATGMWTRIGGTTDDGEFGGRHNITVLNSTQFTYSSNVSSVYPMFSTTSTGGTLYYWVTNHLVLPALPAGTNMYKEVVYRCTGASCALPANAANYSPVWVSYPLTLTGLTDGAYGSWDDYGAISTVGGQSLMWFIPATPPSANVNDMLVTTITNISGTTFTLAANATNSTSSTSVRFDDAPAITAAEAASNTVSAGGGGSINIPAPSSASTFGTTCYVTSSYLVLNSIINVGGSICSGETVELSGSRGALLGKSDSTITSITDQSTNQTLLAWTCLGGNPCLWRKGPQVKNLFFTTSGSSEMLMFNSATIQSLTENVGLTVPDGMGIAYWTDSQFGDILKNVGFVGGPAQTIGLIDTPLVIERDGIQTVFDGITGSRRGLYFECNNNAGFGCSGNITVRQGDEWQGPITPLVTFNNTFGGRYGFIWLEHMIQDSGAESIFVNASTSGSLLSSVIINGTNQPGRDAGNPLGDSQPVISGNQMFGGVSVLTDAPIITTIGMNHDVFQCPQSGSNQTNYRGCTLPSLNLATASYSTSHTLTANEGVVNETGSGTTITANSALSGQVWDVFNRSAGTVTLAISSGTLSCNGATGSCTIPANQGVHVACDGTNCSALGLGGGGGGSPGGTVNAVQSNNGASGFQGTNAPVGPGTFSVIYDEPTAATVAPSIKLPGVPINAQTGTTYTEGSANYQSDRGFLVTASNAGAQTYTMVNPSAAGFGFNYFNALWNKNTGAVTENASGFTVNGGASLLVPPSWIRWLYSDGVNYFATRVPEFGAFPNCLDSGGNHLNFTASTGVLSCGTSASGNGLSGMTAGQVPIAATATSVTSSEALAGAGAGITTGPVSGVTSLDVVEFTGTGGQIADTGFLASNVVRKDAAATLGAFLYDFSASTLKIPTAAGFTASATSMFGYDSTNKNWHIYDNNADAIGCAFSSTPTTGDLVSVTVASSQVLCSDSGTVAANAVTAASAATAAKQTCVSSGASKTCTYIDFPERYFIPAANCNNTTAGAGWSIGSAGVVTCRAGTNNKGGFIAITDTSTTFAQFTITIPEDWDTGANPYIRFYVASTDTTTGHTIIPAIQVSCSKGDGTTTDDVAFNAAHSSSTITLNTTANQFWSNSSVQMNSTDVTGCVAGAQMTISVQRATDTATNAEFYGADVTFPRLLTVGAE